MDPNCARPTSKTYDGRAVLAGPEDNVLEFLGGGQAALGGYGKGLLHRAVGRGLADLADGELLVLLGNGIGHVRGRNA